MLYHSLKNSRAFRQRPPEQLEFELDDCPAIEALLASHPARPVLVTDLPHASLDDKLGVARALYAEGLLVSTSHQNNDGDD